MFDGAVNINGRGVGVVLITSEGGSYAIWCQNNFSLHQHEAEYEACILRLEEVVNIQIKTLDVYGDSTLVINQTNRK